MIHIEALLALSKRAGVVLYIPSLGENTISTINVGELHSEEVLPDWMREFIIGEQSILSFEIEGDEKLYIRWDIGDGKFVVFLDNSKLTTLKKLLNGSLLGADNPNLEFTLLQDKYAKCKLELEALQKHNRSYDRLIATLEAELKALKEQNADQATRLKEEFIKNNDLTSKLRNIA
jgi:hypothetical protein